MAVVRLEAMRALETAIAAGIPDLDAPGAIIVGQAPAGKTLCLPRLVIDPVRFRYYPDQAMEFNSPTSSTLVENVGRHQATIQLRVAAATRGARAELEQQLVDLFLGDTLRPGVLLTPVVTCPALGSFVAAWEFEDDEWDDEKAFDSLLWSVMTVTGTIPALITRGSVHAITDLRLSFSTAEPAPAPPVEVVRINDDGTITAL